MTNLNTLEFKLYKLESELDTLQDQLVDKESELSSIELCNDDYENGYAEYLDDCNGEFMGMNASHILKECDPIAYRCGLNDFVDGIDVTECEEYKELEQEIEDIESSIEYLESEIEELTEEIEELENEED